MKHFIKPVESYRRDFRLLETYVTDSATYISRQTGRPLEECIDFVRREISPDGRFPLNIPDALVLEKNKNGDREMKTVPFDQYLEGVFQANEILSPTLAAYTHPDVKESLLAQYITGNLGRRKKAKGEMFAAEMKGDKTLAAIKDAEQSTFKIKNNSLSGAQCTPSTFLVNKSAHSTLTSTCRVATSYGNANNEKFLYGNRHYWSPDIVKANIVSIINHSDYEKIEIAMREFNLKHPTVEQTMECINRSTHPYWRNTNHTAIIESLVRSLKPIERSAFVYTSDFYHLAACNPDFVRELLTRLSQKSTTPLPFEEADEWVKKMDDNLTAFVSMLCSTELAGGTVKDAKARPIDYGVLGATAKNIIGELDHYEVFIRAFWVTDNLPASIFYLPSIIRRGAITSDTDSTIFTVQHWTEWYVGKLDFSETSLAIASTMVYLASQLIRHILATFSGNMNVAQKDVFRLSMKNEYFFPIFVTTSRAKHYFAYISAREGNVFSEYDTEIKGVALRNSNVPPSIRKRAKELMQELMDTVIQGEKISIVHVLQTIAEIEQSLKDEIESGSYQLLPKTSIKTIGSYKEPNSSNYLHYGLWEEVFADKYGHAPEPPYVAIKVSIDADNPTKLKQWLDSLEDRVIADKMAKWLENNKRRAVNMLLLPEPVLAMTGVPKEAIKGVDIRSLIFQTVESFYLILESLGIYMRNDNITRLVSDSDWKTETR